jgi:hypothetical protein
METPQDAVAPPRRPHSFTASRIGDGLLCMACGCAHESVGGERSALISRVIQRYFTGRFTFGSQPDTALLRELPPLCRIRGSPFISAMDSPPIRSYLAPRRSKPGVLTRRKRSKRKGAHADNSSNEAAPLPATVPVRPEIGVAVPAGSRRSAGSCAERWDQRSLG